MRVHFPCHSYSFAPVHHTLTRLNSQHVLSRVHVCVAKPPTSPLNGPMFHVAFLPRTFGPVIDAAQFVVLYFCVDLCPSPVISFIHSSPMVVLCKVPPKSWSVCLHLSILQCRLKELNSDQVHRPSLWYSNREIPV